MGSQTKEQILLGDYLDATSDMPIAEAEELLYEKFYDAYYNLDHQYDPRCAFSASQVAAEAIRIRRELATLPTIDKGDTNNG
jgi:hypothetical protein